MMLNLVKFLRHPTLRSAARFGPMCRNITTLRGLEPVATPVEIEAAARQYVRKVSGVTTSSPLTAAAVDEAVAQIAAVTTQLLAALPPRRQPPPTLPPLRRIGATTPTGRARPPRPR